MKREKFNEREKKREKVDERKIEKREKIEREKVDEIYSNFDLIYQGFK